MNDTEDNNIRDKISARDLLTRSSLHLPSDRVRSEVRRQASQSFATQNTIATNGGSASFASVKAAMHQQLLEDLDRRERITANEDELTGLVTDFVTEVRAGEALDMLQAMNTGHDGSLTTIHANSPRDAMARLETMVLMAGLDLPSRAIREQAVSAIDIIVQVKRYEDGVRRVQSISELVGMEGDTPQLQEIFRFVSKGKVNRKIVGEFVATGVVPHIVQRLKENDFEVPMHLFQPTHGPLSHSDNGRPSEDRERSW